MKVIQVMPTDNVDFLKNYGVMIDDVPKTVFDVLKTECLFINQNYDNEISKNREGFSGLSSVGTPRHFFINGHRDMIQTYLIEQVKNYDEKYGYICSNDILSHNVPFKLGDLWVNVQRKGEYVPNHVHTGFLSFVIWVKIPYDIRDEIPNIDSYSYVPSTACFEFVYQNILGLTTFQRIFTTKDYEGKILMFPSKLCHCVYPFFSTNENRISISGNIHFDTSKYE